MRGEWHLCMCNHDNAAHVKRTGKCRGRDSYDCACQCPSFEHHDQCAEMDRGE